MDSERDVIGGGGEDRVERAVAAMQGVDVPGVPAGLNERVIERAGGAGSGEVVAVRAAAEKKGSQEKGWWRMKMVRRTAVAAALAVAVGAGALVMPWGGGARVAFADVVEQVKAAKVVTCKVDMEVTMPGEAAKTVTLDMVMGENGVASMSLGKTRTVVEESTGRTMVIDDARKQVTVLDLKKGAGTRAPNLLTAFKTMTGTGKPLGEHVVAGKKAKGFLVEQGRKTFEVWADEATEKPVRVEMRVKEPSMPELHFVFREFDWDPSQAAAVTFEAPAGYKEVKATMDMSGVEEKDLVAMLKAEASFNGGVLPEKVDMGSVLVLLRKWAEAHGGAGGAAAQEALMQEVMPVSRGWAFMGDPSKGGEWTYAGAGVKIGEKKAVLWYRVPGTETWRVIDADGEVHGEQEKPAGGEKVEVDVKGMMGGK
jgi:hypothetical protein